MDPRFDDDFYTCENALAFLDCDAHGNQVDDECGDDGGVSCVRDVLCYLYPYGSTVGPSGLPPAWLY